MDTMTGAVSAYYDKVQEVWIATVTTDMIDFPYRRYKIAACDEFVEPIALLEAHGFHSLRALHIPAECGWTVEDIT